MRPFLRRAAGVLAFAAGAGLLVLAIWYGPAALTHTQTDLPDAERLRALDDARGTLLLGLAAAAALAGVAFTLRTVRISQRSYALQVRGHVTRRYTDALERLGSPDRTVRLGAVVALGSVMADSPEDQPFIVEVLAGFVRERAPWDEADDPQPETLRWICMALRDAGTTVHRVIHDKTYTPVRHLIPTPADIDVQAALTVLGRRTPHPAERAMDLAGTDLRRATLAGHFDRALLMGARLDLARLEGSFRHARFRSACLDGADLDRTELEGANFSHASAVGARFNNARLGRCTFRSVDARHASFGAAWVDYNADFRATDFRHADLRDLQTIRRSLLPAKYDEPPASAWDHTRFTSGREPRFEVRDPTLSHVVAPCGPDCPVTAQTEPAPARDPEPEPVPQPVGLAEAVEHIEPVELAEAVERIEPVAGAAPAVAAAAPAVGRAEVVEPAGVVAPAEPIQPSEPIGAAEPLEAGEDGTAGGPDREPEPAGDRGREA